MATCCGEFEFASLENRRNGATYYDRVRVSGICARTLNEEYIAQAIGTVKSTFHGALEFGHSCPVFSGLSLAFIKVIHRETDVEGMHTCDVERKYTGEAVWK